MSLENYESQKVSIQPFLARHTPLGHVPQAAWALTTADTECGKDGNGRQPAQRPRSASAWVPPAPAAPRASPAPPAGAWPLARGLEVSSGAAPRARPRRGLTGGGAATDPRPNRCGAPLTSAAALLGSRYARRPGRAATPTPFPVPFRPRCPALPRPAAAASAASRDRAAPAAPAVLALLAVGIQTPPFSPVRAPDWTDQRRGGTPPSTLKGTSLGEY